ncbi:MAG: nitroreductase family protein [Armatimonadetes bacterium]|nr:nitroreductase family protein [Armatimonadota bacterium]
MPLEEAMRTQIAIRRLKPDPVDDRLLLHLLDLAIRAPSGSNQQKWDFVVLRDPEVKARLGALNRGVLDLYFKLQRGKPQTPMHRAVRHQAEHFAEIPVVVVACYRGVVPPFPFVAVTSVFGSVYPAVQNLLLAARAAGLGAALITLPLWNQWKARKVLGLPWNVTPCAAIPMGWPLGRYKPNRRAPVEELVHLDRYGNRPFLGR